MQIVEDTKTKSLVSKVYILATPIGTTTRLYSRKSVGLYSIFINRKDFLFLEKIRKFQSHEEDSKSRRH